MLHSAPQLKLPTVLLIDDDPISREVVATVLSLSGHAVHTADSGAAALELLASGTCAPGAILMDAQMPGLSGARLIAELRAHSRAVIVVISATLPNGTADGVVAAADGFLLKPFGAEALQNLIEERKSRAVSSPESLLNDDRPVVSTKTLAQFRGMMPEPAVREIYAAIVADLGKRLPALE
ncbi:MAG: response regulator, partial [Acidobacteriota bacterium]|nr:response regulator [Acidobacteriota bacterium]